jgi:RNA polymerase sigma-54 factor
MLLQRQTTSLRPLTTAHLAQTMSLLELTSLELRQKIESVLANNPALELVEPTHCPNCGRPSRNGSVCQACLYPHDTSSEQPIVFMSTRSDFYTPRGSLDEDQTQSGEEYASSPENLPQYVLKQISPELQPDERLIAAHILTSLDEDGLLAIPILEIVRYRGVLPSKVEKVLKIIQRADPIGVGSPTAQDALLVQLEMLKETRPIPERAAEAIRLGMNLLSKRKYAELARKLGITKHQSQELGRFIADNLNPYPARTHWGESNSGRSPEINSGVYYSPDIIISRQKNSEDTPLVVEIAMPIRGSLRINPMFVDALENAPPEKAEAWKEDLEHATLLVKCLQQRNHTMVRMLQLLTRLQRRFILQGDKHLQPITRASLAKSLELHESTISRAVSDKAVQLPNGKILPLATFFDRSLHIRSVLKQLIEEEASPLSDTELAELLEQHGHNVARRTVAKYRSMEGILPAHLRISRNEKSGLASPNAYS